MSALTYGSTSWPRRHYSLDYAAIVIIIIMLVPPSASWVALDTTTTAPQQKPFADRHLELLLAQGGHGRPLLADYLIGDDLPVFPTASPPTATIDPSAR